MLAASVQKEKNIRIGLFFYLAGWNIDSAAEIFVYLKIIYSYLRTEITNKVNYTSAAKLLVKTLIS